MPRDKRWFGPMPALWKAAVPVSWEGYVVTIAFVMSLPLLKLAGDPIRASIAFTLIVVAYGAIVWLTWGPDPE